MFKRMRRIRTNNAKYSHLKGKKYRLDGYIWEICSILIRIDGIFLYLMRREGKKYIMREVNLDETLVIEGVDETQHSKAPRSLS